MEDISLNKFISDTGVCSRREADKFIAEGRVKLNGVIAQKGNRVRPTDIVLLNNKPLSAKPAAIYIALNKPQGITSTTNRNDKTNIIDFLQFPSRLFPIGRLDKLSDGLIFLTNDGDIVNKILRAGNQHEKEYVVTVNKPINEVFLRNMRKGVPILGTMTLPCVVEREGAQRFRIILTQGLNRQIRRMCETLGYEVKTLTRVRIMNIALQNLKVGEWRYLSGSEIKKIKQLVQYSSKTQEASFFDD
jgi:23S rRNA pseudouridine2604 synthase